MSITFYVLCITPLLVMLALAWRGGERAHAAVSRSGNAPAVESRRAEAA